MCLYMYLSFEVLINNKQARKLLKMSVKLVFKLSLGNTINLILYKFAPSECITIA